MRVLLLEDDEKKKQKILSFLQSADPDISVDYKASLKSGLQAIISNVYDLILLDMSMPTFDISSDEDGWRPQPYAGKKILHQMARKKIKTPTVVVTQFDRFGEGAEKRTLSEINDDLNKEYSDFYKGAIFYDTTQDSWQKELKRVLVSIEK